MLVVPINVHLSILVVYRVVNMFVSSSGPILLECLMAWPDLLEYTSLVLVEVSCGLIRLTFVLFLLGVTSTTTAPESVWGVENEGDDEGDDDSDELKGVIEQGKASVENDYVATSRSKTMAMVEMEVEELSKLKVKEPSCLSIEKAALNPISRVNGQLSVPITFSNSQKLPKLSNHIIVRSLRIAFDY